MAALQLLYAGGDVLVRRHQLAHTNESVNHQNTHLDCLLTFQHGRKHYYAVLGKRKWLIYI
jgi:hypothetical protein